MSDEQSISKSTIGVWIRHENQENGRWFTRWPIEDLDNLIPTLGKWGLRDDDEGVEIPQSDLFGTFVIVDGVTRFEVMIVDQGGEES